MGTFRDDAGKEKEERVRESPSEERVKTKNKSTRRGGYKKGMKIEID